MSKASDEIKALKDRIKALKVANEGETIADRVGKFVRWAAKSEVRLTAAKKALAEASVAKPSAKKAATPVVKK